MAKVSKYKAKRCEIDGIKFDSIAEGDYYLYLKKFLNHKAIIGFDLQPEFIIQEKFKHGVHGNIRAIIYKADFLVKFHDGVEVIVDVKGLCTPVALLKRKMFLKKFPDLILQWISKSKKHGVSGWIDYFKLEKIRKANRKLKGK